MSLFEIILISLLGVYVLSNLYFSISGRILAIKGRKEDLERRNKDEEYENQLKILAKRSRLDASSWKRPVYSMSAPVPYVFPAATIRKSG